MSWTDEKTCPICAERIKWAALICHYCGHEFTLEELSAQTAELRRVNELRTEFPNQLGDFSYRVENDKSVSAIDRNGNPIDFRDWQSFWRASQISSSGPSPPPLPQTQKPVAVAAGNRPPWPIITFLAFVGVAALLTSLGDKHPTNKADWEQVDNWKYNDKTNQWDHVMESRPKTAKPIIVPKPELKAEFKPEPKEIDRPRSGEGPREEDNTSLCSLGDLCQ